MSNPNPVTKRFTSETAAENGRKGGIKSGEARRRRRSLRKAAEELLNMPLRSGEIKEELKNLAEANAYRDADGKLVPPNLTVDMAIMVTQVREALNGNTQAANFISELLGEKVQKVEVKQNIDESRMAMNDYFESKRQEELANGKDEEPGKHDTTE